MSRVIVVKSKRLPRWRMLTCKVCHAKPARLAPDGSCSRCGVFGSLFREYSASCILLGPHDAPD
jgi:hypothetical protein